MTTIPESFTHLEVHSHYTLLGSTLAVGEVVSKAVGEGLGALALTDTNVLYGQVSFGQACVNSGIKPIIGMAVDMAPPSGMMGVRFNQPGRLVLLAIGRTGYRSLCQLSSYLQRKTLNDQALEWGTLKENRDGLICVTGGRQGWIERFMRAGQPKEAARIASYLGGMFEDRCYLSILPKDEEREFFTEILNLGQRFGLPPVAVQPIYCFKAQELTRLKLLQAIDRNCLLEEISEETLPHQGDMSTPIHWPTREEVAIRYADYPDALANVGEIVKICQPGLPDGTPIWPVLPFKKGRENPDDALKTLSQTGLRNMYPRPVDKFIKNRLDKELQVIRDHGFAPLFLIVADIVNFARKKDIPVNTRGSVANSLTAYVTGITNVDPIAHDLLFERFLNPARISLPDIDLDFCSRRRDEVLSYLRSAYGDQRMALVATISTFRLRSAIRETAKAYGLDAIQIKKLTEIIPHRWHPDPSRRQTFDLEEITSGLTNEADVEIIHAAYDLVGHPHHLSIHPGGIVLTPGPLTDVVPVQMAPKGFLITQFDFRDLELIGLPKIDLLGIRALTVLADTADLIRELLRSAIQTQ